MSRKEGLSSIFASNGTLSDEEKANVLGKAKAFYFSSYAVLILLGVLIDLMLNKIVLRASISLGTNIFRGNPLQVQEQM